MVKGIVSAIMISFAIGLIVLGVVNIRSANEAVATARIKTRVPTMPEDVEAAQKAAQDARFWANSSQKSFTDLQAELQKAQAKSSPVGRETTGPGVITDFGMFPLETGDHSDDMYVGFTFTENKGFTKRFFPVCPSQTVKTGNPISLIYHWRVWGYNAQGRRGCFIIDGFQQ